MSHVESDVTWHVMSPLLLVDPTLDSGLWPAYTNKGNPLCKLQEKDTSPGTTPTIEIYREHKRNVDNID